MTIGGFTNGINFNYNSCFRNIYYSLRGCFGRKYHNQHIPDVI